MERSPMKVLDMLSELPLAPLVTCTTVFTGFCLAYSSLSPRFETERKRAYILSTISSFTMTLISLPYVWTYLVYGMEACFETAQSGRLLRLGQFAVMFFGTYLTADLLLGYFKYRSQVGLLTGWIHHSVYIAIMFYLYNTRQSPFFLVAAIMELPTFDLAISNLFPATRNDLRFLSGFFLIRILYHVGLLLDCLRPVNRALMDGSWVPLSTMSLALVLHASWFQGGVKGYLKRQAKESVRPVEAMLSPTQEVESGNDALLEADSEPGTPEDSPLVTPHTPKSYAVLSNLPNLPTMPHLPSLSNIPTVSIPSLSDFTSALHTRDQLNFGFKDAVKNRWEEQKGRFNDIRRGGGLDLGRLGLRRRGADGLLDDPDVEVVAF